MAWEALTKAIGKDEVLLSMVMEAGFPLQAWQAFTRRRDTVGPVEAVGEY